MKKLRWIHGTELAILILFAVILSWGTALERQQQGISNRLIRLHVVANSDSAQDQSRKLAVRDAVLEQAALFLDGAASQNEAKEILRANLGLLEQTANKTLAAEGTGQQARVTLERDLFGTRDYEGFALPGGYYDALRVQIGSGEGHNWWCVVYPQICTAATAEDRETVAVMGGLDREQMAILEGDTVEYQLKFRSLEILEDLLGWFRGGRNGIPASG